jgi:hypothetical protein
MRNPCMTFFTFAVASVAFVFFAVAPAQAQGRGGQRGAAGPTGPAPRLANGHPDLSGVWNGGGGIAANNLKPGDSISMTPSAEAIFKNRKSAQDPEANCLPTGIPRMAPYPWRMVQAPTDKPETHIFILFEGNIHSYRQIFMDGRKHPSDPDPTWYGHSVGHWEGDTLVVDTVGFNDKFWFDFLGHPHTELLHTVERFKRTDLGTLQWDITIEDPGAYTKPFTVLTRARLLPNDELMEYICTENNTNLPHLQGPAVNPGN